MNDAARRKIIVRMQEDARLYSQVASLNVTYAPEATRAYVEECRAETRYWQRRSAECTASIRYILGIEP